MIVACHENRFEGSEGAAEQSSIGSLVMFRSSCLRRLLVRARSDCGSTIFSVKVNGAGLECEHGGVELNVGMS